jgi:hypothetical protein
LRFSTPAAPKKPTTGLEPVNLILTKDVLYQLSYMGGHNIQERAMRLELTTSTLEGWSSTN